MTTPQFLDFINDKYDDPDGIHHYEKSQDSGDTKVKIEVFNEVDEDAYTGLTPITNREYEENEQDKKRQIKLLDDRYLGAFMTEFKELMEETLNEKFQGIKQFSSDKIENFKFIVGNKVFYGKITASEDLK